MSSYQVGANKPIKLRVTISTAGHAVTNSFLNDPNNDGQILIPPKSSSFSNTDNAGWRQINGGNVVKGRSIKVKTILTFPSEMPDKRTFDLAVAQAKRSYKVELSGGAPSPLAFDFDVKSIFSPFQMAQFTSIINLT